MMNDIDQTIWKQPLRNHRLPSDNKGTLPSAKPKYLALADAIQADIQSGKFPCGAKLPPLRELTHLHEVAYLTVCQSMELLARRGLIVREQGRGTFVKANHVSAKVAILSSISLNDETAHFYRALDQTLHAELALRDWIGSVYAGHGGGDESLGLDWKLSPNFSRFLEDLRNGAFDGLIALAWPENWEPHPKLLNFPIVRLTERPTGADVFHDWEHFGYESVAFLEKIGKRAIVYLRTYYRPESISMDLCGMNRAVKEFRLPEIQLEQLPPVRGGANIELETYRKTLQLAAHWRRSKQWPDALIVTDDIGTRGAALALIKERVQVPKQLAVLTTASEGVCLHYGISAIKYQIRPREIAFHLVDRLHQRMNNPAIHLDPVLIRGSIQWNSE